LDIRKVLFTAKLVLVAVLVVVVVKTTVVLWRAASAPTPASAADTEGTTALKPTSQVGSSTKDYTTVIEQNVFSGTALSSPVHKALLGNSAAPIVPSAEDELGLVLLGTVAGSPLVSRAIIQDTESKIPQLYKIGEIVAGARVQSIENNVVILLHNGQSKILRLQIGRDHGQSQAQVSRSQTSGEFAQASKSDTQVTAIPPEQTGQVETILSSAVIEPYSVNGKTQGLKVTGLENLPIAKEIGLKDGDIVREVNGQQLTDKRKAYQVLKKTRSQPSVSVELQREGKTKELSFALR
jgi:general secretion pathway protein C